MVMEFGGLSGAKWTDNSPRPFARSPGAGLNGVDLQSGFAADNVVSFADEAPTTIIGKGDVSVRKLPIAQGKIPSLLIKRILTDRGTVTQELLDTALKEGLKSAGFRVSKASSFEAVPVSWQWFHETQGDFYYPIISKPPQFAGLKYSGNAIPLPDHTGDNALLAKLPANVYVYTFAATSDNNTMSDADAAKALTVLTAITKQATTQLAGAQSYGTIDLTVLGSDPDIFPKPPIPVPVIIGGVGLLLVAAVNLLSPHIKDYK